MVEQFASIVIITLCGGLEDSSEADLLEASPV